MRKHTTIDLVTDLVAEAAAALGTRRTTGTMHAALSEVAAACKRLRLLDFKPDLSKEDLTAMRRGRYGPGGAPVQDGG